ncbi:hypothetical protein KY349_03305 [Candidatus Woesearchaeota archaeon]|jgi:hypothetical protein|nr:hypothetical protein [Candidatus Woesearchaeota archaeon]
MDNREKILAIVKEKGPLLPAQINKELRTDVLFASAMLSEMVDQKKLMLTSMKIGGSPLYYCTGQEHIVEKFAHKLTEKNYRVFELLKKSNILRDRDQDPQSRVALREIKDFAVPLEVSANSKKDLFWKFYSVSDKDAETLIKDYINAKAAKQEPPKMPEKPIQKEVQATFADVKKPVQPAPAQPRPAPAPPKPEVQKPPAHVVEAPKPVTSVKMTTLDEDEVPEFSYQTSVSFSTTIDTDEKVKIEKKKEEPQPEVKVLEFPEDDEFFNKIRSFFNSSGIEILDFTNIRKGTEYDFIINLPSNVGSLEYYCKAKSKSKVSDGDLSTAFVYGQMKKLPILFLTMGDLTKTAKELLGKEFKSMFVKKIE